MTARYGLIAAFVALLHQSISLQNAQCFTHRRAANAQLAADRQLADALIRPHSIGKNFAGEVLNHLVHQTLLMRGFALAIFHLRCQATLYTRLSTILSNGWRPRMTERFLAPLEMTN